MDKTTKEVKKSLNYALKKFKGEELIKYYAQLAVASLAILRGAKGDKFVDDFLIAAIGDKEILTGKKEAVN